MYRETLNALGIGRESGKVTNADDFLGSTGSPHVIQDIASNSHDDLQSLRMARFIAKHQFEIASLPAEHAYIAWAVGMAMLIASLYIQARIAEFCLLLVALGSSILSRNANMKMRPVDWSVLSISAVEVISIFYSQYSANSIRSAWLVVCAILIYYLIRINIRTATQVALLSTLLGIAAVGLSFYGLRLFTVNARLLGAAGFSQLVPFRSRLISPPSSWLPGEWFTVLLMGLPFSFAILVRYLIDKKKRQIVVATLPTLVVTLTLLLSLSRAVFWSLVLFFSLACALLILYRLVPPRTSALLVGIVFTALLVIVSSESIIYPGLYRAYIRQDISQTRSTAGRFGIWNRAFALVGTHPFVGIGSGNTALALLSTTDQEDTAGFASRAFSLPVQVVVENGMFGCILYSTFLILIFTEFTYFMRRPHIQSEPSIRPAKLKNNCMEIGIRSRYLQSQKAMACCFMAGLVCILFRELTYSSLFEHSLTLILFVTLAALAWSPLGAECESP